MQLVKTFASSVQGVNAFTVAIEVSVFTTGQAADMKHFMVGLPDNSIRESWHRIESAVKENSFTMPRTKIVVNMERFHDERVADRGIPSFQGRPADVKSSQFFGDPRRSNSNIEVLSFNSLIEHRFESGVMLRNRTNYSEFDKFYENVFANGPVFGSFVDNPFKKRNGFFGFCFQIYFHLVVS